MTLLSNREQLEEIRIILSRYMRLPFFTGAIPGAVLEAILAHVRGGTRLNTYDFVDVIDRKSSCGWQIKSTLESTPVTWKRAKIPNALELIKASKKTKAGAEALGRAILEFCNRHLRQSMDLYGLEKVGYCRLLIQSDGVVKYFERELCGGQNPSLFDPDSFTWKWSKAKKTQKKEQLPALHGLHKATGRKWWAWHGLGENQLHFSGERNWWPAPDDPHAIIFQLTAAEKRLSLEQFVELLGQLDIAS